MLQEQKLCTFAMPHTPLAHAPHHDNDYTLFKADWTSKVKNEMK